MRGGIKFARKYNYDKYKKLLTFANNITNFRKKYEQMINSNIHKDQLKGVMLKICDVCFFRPGRYRNKVKNNTTGFSTMDKNNIKIQDNNCVEINFIGKYQTSNKCKICNDKKIISILKEAIKRNTLCIRNNHNEINKCLSDGLTCKDWRTWSANKLFIEYFLKTLDVNKSLDKVSKRIFNKKFTTKRYYIDPKIIEFVKMKSKKEIKSIPQKFLASQNKNKKLEITQKMEKMSFEEKILFSILKIIYKNVLAGGALIYAPVMHQQTKGCGNLHPNPWITKRLVNAPRIFNYNIYNHNVYLENFKNKKLVMDILNNKRGFNSLGHNFRLVHEKKKKQTLL